MTVVSLLKMISSLSLLLPVSPSWENCALNLIEKQHPSSVTFVCKSAELCPSNSLYNMVKIPARTLYALESHELPDLKTSDLVFIVISPDFFVWSNETIEKYRLKGKNRFKIVFVVNENRDNFMFMENVFSAMWASGVVNAAVLLTNNEVYTYQPFKNSEKCEDISPVLLGECIAVSHTLFDTTFKVRNLNKCPLRVSLTDDRPFARYPSSGRLIKLIYEMSLRMNFSIVPITPDTGKLGGMCGPDEYKGSRGDVFAGRAHMAVASFNRESCSTLEYLSLPYTQCLSWCTPVISGNAYIYLFIVQQLQARVWFALFLTILVVVFTLYFICSVTQDKISLKDAIYFFIVVFAPVPVKARSNPVRLVFGLWVLCCVVIRTAYEGELKSESAVPLGSHIIRTLEELAEMEIQLCSTFSGLETLEQSNDSAVQKLYKNSVVCNGSLHENMMTAAKLKDRAIFTSDLRCGLSSSEISKERSNLYSSTGGCFMMYQLTLIVTMRGSPFKDRWEIIQQRCIEAGLINKWLNLQPVRQESGEVKAYTINHLKPALFVLFVGWGSGIVILLAENAFSWWSLLNEESGNRTADSETEKLDLGLRQNTPTETVCLDSLISTEFKKELIKRKRLIS